MATRSWSEGWVDLKAYAGMFQSAASDELPATWAIVEVGPESWMATLPVHELFDVVNDGSREVHLGGIPHHWHHEALVLELGPVWVSGSREEWRSLCWRLADTQRTTEGLYETPGAREWAGPVTEMAVADVGVDGAVPERGSNLSPMEELAMAGGFTRDDFIEIFGAAWVPSESAVDDHVLRYIHPVFVWGEPPQLAAGIDRSGLVIGRPRGEWAGGTHGLIYELDDPTPVDSSMPQAEVREIVRGHLRRRRRSLGWCRYCGVPLPPERRWEPGVCQGCAMVWFGVVF